VATWFVFKTDNGEVGLSNTEALDLSAGSTVEGAAAIGNDPTVAFPSTYPTTSIVSGAEAMMMYLAYTASGGGGGGSAPVLYRRAAHFVDESLILE
jgi:hypothetical protein